MGLERRSASAEELKGYLGDRYDEAALEHYQRTLDEEWARCRDEARFYRSSQAYLYNLTAFAMTGTKLPYLRELTRVVPPGSRVLDYGCGIGSDGLMLLEAGYRVEFADFDNPSDRLPALAARSSAASTPPVHDLDNDVPGGFDAAFAFDVIEHVRDPWAFLREMESRAALVEVNLLEFDEHQQELHYELPIAGDPRPRRRATARAVPRLPRHLAPRPLPARTRLARAAPAQPADALGGEPPTPRASVNGARPPACSARRLTPARVAVCRQAGDVPGETTNAYGLVPVSALGGDMTRVEVAVISADPLSGRPVIAAEAGVLADGDD